MKKDIINRAVNTLEVTHGLTPIWKESVPLDGILKLTVNGIELKFIVDVKQEVRINQLLQIDINSREYENYLLVANRIFHNTKEELRKRNIPYIETNGNIYLRKGNIYLYVDTNRNDNIKRVRGNRAFTKTGLKVLFYLLQYKEAINLPQRKLAEKTGVALGNIPEIIKGLRETGYLTPLNKKDYVWENRENLLNRWINDYGTVLKPKLNIDKYSFKGNWQNLKFNLKDTVWGGEPAADILTNHLRPEKFLIYTRERRTDLIKNYQLIPNENGEIDVLEMFWEQENVKTAPPLLVYTDLILEGGKRNKETANIIYNEFLKQNL
ncbi:MAG: hypothetical protein GX154_03920 [Clostridiales bacterium]|nr:hypothetical protein [Clostridiales bacterium]